MKIIALTGRAGSGKDTAALAIRLLTGSLDPAWMMSIEGCPIIGPNRHVVDLQEFFDIKWPNQSTDENNKWKVMKFAEPVYQIAAVITGHDPNDPEAIMNSGFKNKLFGLGGVPKTGRELLQLIGTEFGRTHFANKIWISILEDKLLKLSEEKFKGVIVTDCRFLNEAIFLNSLRATIIRMVGRDGGVPLSHSSESEMELIEPDYIVDNRLDYKYLMDQIQEICTALRISNHQYKWK